MAYKDMKTGTKVLMWVGIAVTLGVTGVVVTRLIQRYKDKKDKTTTDPNAKLDDVGIVSTIFGNTPKTCRHCVKDATFPLMKGSQGKQVASVQYAYNSRFPNKPQLTVDGDWGNKSESAFIALMGGTSNFTGWDNAVGSISGAGASLTEQGVKIDKVLYDKYFKGYEQF